MSSTKNQVIEFAPFTLAEGVDESTLAAASDALQKDFLSRQKGFIKRDLTRMADRQWADVIYWENRESVEQAMQTAPENPAALEYFELMAAPENGGEPAANTILSVVKSYS